MLSTPIRGILRKQATQGESALLIAMPTVPGKHPGQEIHAAAKQFLAMGNAGIRNIHTCVQKGSARVSAAVHAAKEKNHGWP